jgi:flagellar basal body-associated protein FliL
MENQYQYEQNAAPRPSKKGLVTLTVIAAILFVTAVGLGTVYFLEMGRANDLQHQVSDLKTTTAQLNDAMAKKMAEPTGSTKPAVNYREIPELGVKYKLTDQIKDLTYSIKLHDNDSARDASFSTVALSGLQNNAKEYPCLSQNAPSGTISRYVNGDQMLMGKTVKEIGKKLGNYYYVYAHPQYACSINGATADGLQASIDAVKAAYDSLEVM